MVAVIPAVHKILSYVPFLLVLIDLRYEGKPSQTMDFNLFYYSYSTRSSNLPYRQLQKVY